MIKPNWDKFKEKFNDNPEYYFEYFCYLLFCLEFDKPQGVFRYKNQSDIEWNSIEVDGKTIVSQCKFYDDKLGNKKNKILEMLEGIHKNYPTPCELKFYTNQDWGQGKKKDTNDSQPKIEIEEKAKDYNITIEWRTNEAYFLSPDVVFNQELAKHFFTDESIYDLIYEKQQHTENILYNIRTEIEFDSKIIELDRTGTVDELEDRISKNQALILSGVGGVGKTAIIKKVYEKENIPFYVLKASEFNVPLVDNLFGKYNLQKFIDIHENYNQKIVVIDSSEKLLDIDNLNPFEELLSTLIKNKWKIIFTTRDSYLDDLQRRFIDLGIAIPTIIVKNLSQEELNSLAHSYSFELSKDIKLNELIKNPFYLNEYLRFYKKDKGLDYLEFKNKIWNHNIKKTNTNREKCFLGLAFKGANEGNFYVDIDCVSGILDALVQDGILGNETAGNFITHDIYEEWALEKIIDKGFTNRNNSVDFFEKIGSSLPIRRSFRSWVSEKLLLDSDDIKSFIEEIIDNEDILSFWKDEVFVSILLSEYSDIFFENFEKELLENDCELLKRISFLLRLACKEADNSHLEQYNLNIDTITIFSMFNKPKGNGWKNFIIFIYKHIDTIRFKNINYILPILYDWNLNNKKGETTRLASLIVLEYYKWINQEEYKYRYDEHIEKICNVIISGTSEIQKELEYIFDEIIKHKWKDSRDNYYRLSIIILTTQYVLPRAFPVLQNMSEYVLKLADLFWTYTPEELPRGVFGGYERDEVETAFGIEKNGGLRYYPVSALQTPIYYLLKLHQNDTVDFILDFVNKCVEKYAESSWEEVQKVDVNIDEVLIITQYHSQALWNMYRGTSSPVMPNLLKSIHMALEKYILEVIKKSKQEDIEIFLKYLLIKSKSSSITAIVASVVLAYPEKTFSIAIILFKTKEFIQADFIRQFKDYSEVKSLYGMGYGLNISNKEYIDERLKTCEDKHRNWHLESLFLNYQLFRDKEVSEKEAEKIQKILWNILDNYYKELPVIEKQREDEKRWNIALSRMDRRKMNTEVKETKKGFELTFNSELSPELQEYSETSQEEYKNTFKYSSLRLWAYNKINNNSDYKKYQTFEDNPLLALAEIKEILKVPHDERDFIFNDETLVETSVILLKDYNEKLSPEDKTICRDIILDFSKLPFTKNYRYQATDGSHSAIRYLPILLDDYPKFKNDIKVILLFNLFREIGMNGRSLNDNGIEAIVDYYDEKEIESFILGYLFLKPKYDSLYHELRKENYRIDSGEVIEKFFEKYEVYIDKYINSELKIEDVDFEIDLAILSVIMKFIKFQKIKPNSIFKEISNVFILKIFKPKVREETPLDKMTKEEQIDEVFLSIREEFEDIDLEIKQRFFSNFPYLIYKLDIVEIESYLKPLLNNFRAREDMSYLLLDFILVQDALNKYDKFWSVLNLFEDRIIEICKDGEYGYTDKIIQTYLLAWSPYGAIWNKEAKNWHTLKEKDKRFFKRISNEIGHCPSTLYSISKLLSGIGSAYLNDGIGWISIMVKNNKNLLTDNLEPDTVFNIENLTRKYIIENSEKIKKEKVKKQEVLEILNFLVEKGSAIGYMLRERIL